MTIRLGSRGAEPTNGAVFFPYPRPMACGGRGGKLLADKRCSPLEVDCIELDKMQGMVDAWRTRIRVGVAQTAVR